jgi:DNA-binding response OmpR family regulator
MSAAPTVLIVDDEADLRAMLGEYLGAHGIAVRGLDSGAKLVEEIARHRPDLILLDVNMPGEDGFTHLRRLRELDAALPVIMLTAAGRVEQRVGGLRGGADDYVVKPFDVRELLARIRAVLERTAGSRAAAAAPALAPFGPLAVDLAGRRLLSSTGVEIPLTAGEFDLVALFAANPRKVLSRSRLRALDQRPDGSDNDRSVDIRVTRLRRKIEPDPERPTLIRTVRGEGYVFDPEGG